MTKIDLINAVAKENGFAKGKAADLVELVIETLKANLAEGQIVKIAGFGTFIVRKKGERMGRNPRTREEVPIPPRKVVTFKASKQFKAIVENPPIN